MMAHGTCAQVLELLFVSYARVIKKSPRGPLLDHVLRGVAQFAHQARPFVVVAVVVARKLWWPRCRRRGSQQLDPTPTRSTSSCSSTSVRVSARFSATRSTYLRARFCTVSMLSSSCYRVTARLSPSTQRTFMPSSSRYSPTRAYWASLSCSPLHLIASIICANSATRSRRRARRRSPTRCSMRARSRRTPPPPLRSAPRRVF